MVALFNRPPAKLYRDSENCVVVHYWAPTSDDLQGDAGITLIINGIQTSLNPRVVVYPPTKSITLYSLDLLSMQQALVGYRRYAGTCFDLSSVKLTLLLLRAGRADKWLPSTGDHLRGVGFMIALLFKFVVAMSVFQLAFIGIVLGSAIGGAIDGYHDIHGLLDRFAISKKVSFLKRIAVEAMALMFSSVVSVFLVPHVMSRLCATPFNVLDLAQAVSDAEKKMPDCALQYDEEDEMTCHEM